MINLLHQLTGKSVVFIYHLIKSNKHMI